MLKNKIYRRYMISILCIIMLLIGWWIFILSNVEIMHEWTLESGEGQWFTAEADSLSKIGFCMDDINAEPYAESLMMAADVSLYDQKGTQIWNSRDNMIPVSVNSLVPAEGVVKTSIRLVMGQKYRIICDTDDLDARKLTFSFYGGTEAFFPLFLILGCMLLILYSVLYFCYYGIFHISYLKAFFVVMVLLGAASTVVLIPYGVPDEPMHFSNAYFISDIVMKKMARSDAGMVSTGILRNPIFGNGQSLTNFWSSWNYGNKLIPCANRYTLIGGMPHYSYVIPAFGLTIARLMSAPYQIVLIAGRMTNYLMYVLIVLLAMRVCPKMKWAVAAISFLPSTVWLADSYSYDAWNLAFCILLVCYCVRCREAKFITWKNLLTIGMITLLFAPIKFIYVLIALMVLVIPREKIAIRHKKKAIALAGVVVLLIIAVLIIARGDEVMAFLGSSNFDANSDAARAGMTYSPAYVLQHPMKVMLVFIHTIIANFESYVVMGVIGENYAEYVPSFILVVMILLCVAVMAGTGWNLEVLRSEKRVSWLVFAFGVLSVLAAFLFLFSAPDSDSIGLITGVQGRYFLPFMIITPFLYTNKQCAGSLSKYTSGMALLSEIAVLAKFAGIIGS